MTNPLDWQHFYEMLSALRAGERTDFTVVTAEGDRLVGEGEVSEFEKWSDKGRYGFMIKVKVRHQKSLTDRRIRGPTKKAATPPAGKEKIMETHVVSPRAQPAAVITTRDMSDFKDLLRGSLTMDMSSSA